MRGISIFVILILFNEINGQQKELVASHVLYRHGDRTPIETFPADQMKEKDWPNGFGQLTIAGIRQHHRLGRYLRTRYGSLLSSNYNRSEIVVRSTDYDRTLMSAEANLFSLYPLYNVSSEDLSIQPIPIHTVPMLEDFLLGVSDCPRDAQLEEEVNRSDEVKQMNTYYEAFFKKLQAWTNSTIITVYNTWSIADTIFIEHLYNKTPVWADAGVRQNLSDINDKAFRLYYAAEDSKRIRGGPLIEDIWLNMDNSSHGQPFRKVKMYSAYASALFVDLYKQNSEYFVRVEYLNVTDSNVAYPYVLDGCSSYECPLDKFTAIYRPRFPGKADVECAIKPPPRHEGNKKLIITLSFIVASLVVIVFIIFFCLHFRKTDRDAPLLSASSAYEVA